MLTSPNAKRVRATKRTLEKARDNAKQKQAEFYAAVVAIHEQDGLTSGAIEREFRDVQISKSNAERIFALAGVEKGATK